MIVLMLVESKTPLEHTRLVWWIGDQTQRHTFQAPSLPMLCLTACQLCQKCGWDDCVCVQRDANQHGCLVDCQYDARLALIDVKPGYLGITTISSTIWKSLSSDSQKFWRFWVRIVFLQSHMRTLKWICQKNVSMSGRTPEIIPVCVSEKG